MGAFFFYHDSLILLLFDEECLRERVFCVTEKGEIIEKSKQFYSTKIDLAKSLCLTYVTLQTILKQDVTLDII